LGKIVQQSPAPRRRGTRARRPPAAAAQNPIHPSPPKEFRALLREPSLHVMLTHDAVELGPGALPVGQRSFLQEVTLTQRGGPRVRLLYWLNMHADGCWLIRKFEAR
jgi:hypothetical protein